MKQSFGPILYARGQVESNLRYTVLATSPDISGPGQSDVRELARHGSHVFYAADLAVPQAEQEQRISYQVAKETFHFSAPGRRQKLRIAFTSCNGSERDEPGQEALPAQNAMWQHLNNQHAEAPFHLQFQGGDQIYADSLWRRVSALTHWKQQPRSSQYIAPFSPELQQDVRSHYFGCYLTQWSRPELRAALSSIP